MLSARVRAVTVCLPVATRDSAMNFPTLPPACQKSLEFGFLERERERSTYADDGDVLNSVGETHRLVVGVVRGHVDSRVS